jgi:hypothetical protein
MLNSEKSIIKYLIQQTKTLANKIEDVNIANEAREIVDKAEKALNVINKNSRDSYLLDED